MGIHDFHAIFMPFSCHFYAIVMCQDLCLDLDGDLGPLKLGDTGREIFISAIIPQNLTAPRASAKFESTSKTYPQYHESIMTDLRQIYEYHGFWATRRAVQMTCPSCAGNNDWSASRPASMTARTPWKCRVWPVAIPTWSMRHRRCFLVCVESVEHCECVCYHLDAVQTSINRIHLIFI